MQMNSRRWWFNKFAICDKRQKRNITLEDSKGQSATRASINRTKVVHNSIVLNIDEVAGFLVRILGATVVTIIVATGVRNRCIKGRRLTLVSLGDLNLLKLVILRPIFTGLVRIIVEGHKIV